MRKVVRPVITIVIREGIVQRERNDMYIDTVTELARKAGIQPIQEFAVMGGWLTNVEAVLRFANLVAEHERKECAKIAERIDPQVASAIRSRKTV